MGLLDIWNDWRKETGYFQDSSSNLQAIAQNSDTINRNKINRGRNIGITSDPMKNAINQSGKTEISRQNVDQVLQKRGLNQRSLMLDPKNAQAKINAAQRANAISTDPITQGGVGVKQAEDLSVMQKLANWAHVDMDKAKATWKEKGGFEGLMANPAFTMGLAFMQAGAEGKTLGAGALDNVMKAGGISSHYKKIIEDRKQEPIQATAGDIDEVKGLLNSIGISEGNVFEKVWSKVTGQGNQQMKFDLAAEEIAVQFQKEVTDWQAKNKHPDGTPKIIRSDDKIKILKRLIKDKKVKFKESWLSKIGLTKATVEKDYNFRAQGGPIQAGKPYVVGEKGPEIIIPRSDGNVLSNDDSQIYAMLLAANPQLQKVSKIRAEKILRNRFPEYFE